jgi:DNA mismatch repair ATPase MutS
MRDDVRAAVDGLAAVRYRLRIGEHRIVVGAPADERSYLAELEDLFARFRSVQDAPRAEDGFESIDMRPLEAQILERVAKLAPGPLAAMTAAVQRHAGFMDPALERLAAEAAFYLGWLQLLAPLRGSGLGWCLPSVDPSDGAVSIDGAFDLALAVDLTRWGEPVVANTVHLAPDERVAVITGPNRTGKTALARAMGQIHLLAAAGCPVPAVAARVPLVDAVYTQADRAEGLGDPGGRLELDLRQVVSILRDLTPRGLVIFNEPFASTTVDDALELSRTVLDDVRRLGARAVVVTFLHELAGDAASVSLVCGAADGGAAGAAATAFQMRRAPAEGLAHAHTVAARYGLTADDVRKRVAR